MKLIYAGIGEAAKPFTDLLYNCTRNQKCQRDFYVPVLTFADIVLYADLPGNPELIEIEVMNACDIENVGTAVSNKYVAGQKPDLSWYTVLGDLSVVPPVGVTYTRFFFKVSFTINDLVYFYYSQQYEFPWCTDLTFIRGCYPNEPVGSDATDCNGIYYGFPVGNTYSGEHNYRYIHSAYLRMASIIEQSNNLSFTAFNSRKNYRTELNREYLLESDIVPKFFKDEIIGILNRGNIQVDGVEWLLSETQDFKVIDLDSKWWRLDILLAEKCKQAFDCKPSDCVFPVEPCCTPVVINATSTVEAGGCVSPFVVLGSNLPDGALGVPYLFEITLGGTEPFGLIINTKPSWMSITVLGDTITVSGTPDVSGVGIPVDFTITGCEDTTFPYSDEIEITEGCIEPGIGSGETLTDATVGVPYDHTMTLTGTPPFNLLSVVKPAWMTIAVVGSTIEFSGTPVTDGDVTVSFSINNCGETLAEVDQTLTVSPAAPSCTNYQITGVPSASFEWEDCNTGNLMSTTLAAGNQQFVCARDGSMSLTGGDGTINSLGACSD